MPTCESSSLCSLNQSCREVNCLIMFLGDLATLFYSYINLLIVGNIWALNYQQLLTRRLKKVCFPPPTYSVCCPLVQLALRITTMKSLHLVLMATPPDQEKLKGLSTSLQNVRHIRPQGSNSCDMAYIIIHKTWLPEYSYTHSRTEWILHQYTLWSSLHV